MATRDDAATGGSGGGVLSLDELIALNDEIAALVRVGVPLEAGLLGTGGELGGTLGAISTALGERMARGEGLAQALEAEGGRIPRVYRAVVEAGLRAGRLPAALEGLARSSRQSAELRRAIGVALLYPLIVLSLAYALLLGCVLLVVPRFQAAFESLRLPSSGALGFLAGLGRTAIYWGPVGPAVLLAVGLAWAMSGRASRLQPGGSARVLRRVPWVRSLLISSEAAGFAELLALLLEHGVPLPEAIPLAAEASGGPALVAAARELAESVGRGEPLRVGVHAPAAGAFPPLLRWLMTTGDRQGTLVTTLRHAAETYRRRAIERAELIRVALPTLMLLAIGATSTLVLTLTLIVPLTRLFEGLSSHIDI